MKDWNSPELGELVAAQEAQITPDIMRPYEKLVIAGLKAALHKGPGGILYALGRRENVVLIAVRGAINMVGTLKSLSPKPPPEAAMVYASFTLLMRALDFASAAKLIEVDNELIDRATRLWMNNIMTGFGISPGALNKMSEMVDGVIQDDAKMDTINRYTGYIKDPRVPQRTLPDEGDE